MKLTAQVIQNAPNIINPEGKLTLVLRNLQISFIENLDVTQDNFAVIDFSNNELVDLGGVAALPALETLLLANNNISNISGIGSSLVSMSLVNNNISKFSQLLELRKVPLTSLLMTGNPVAREHHFRLFLVWLIPTLKVLDCQKVKESERKEARELFGGSFDEATAAATALMHGGAVVAVEKSTRLMANTVQKLTQEEKAKLISDLEKADSMEEIERISAALKDGYVE